MTEGLEQISRLIAHYAIFESVYCKRFVKVNEPLRGTLVRLYAAILLYLSQAGRFYESSTVKRVAKSVITSPDSAVGELLRRVHVEESFVAQLAKLADAEISSQIQAQIDLQACRSQECFASISLKIEEIRKRQMQLESHYAEDRLRLQSMLDSFQSLITGVTTQFEGIHQDKIGREPSKSLPWRASSQYRQHHAKLLEGIPSIPANWLTRKQEQSRRHHSDSSSILWLQSSRGSDTSKAMALVAEALSQKTRASPEAASVAFFYCHYIEPEMTKSDIIAQAIIEQLSSSGSEKQVSPGLVRMYEAKTTPGMDLKTYTALALSLTERRPAKIIIDKLDECRPDCRDELLDALRTIVKKSHSPVKILISSRDPAGNALDFEDVSTMNLRHSLELAAVMSPFVDTPPDAPSFHIVDDQLIHEMESLGERMKRLMPVPDEEFWCDLLHLEILVTTLHNQRSMKDQLPDPLEYLFRRILGRVAPDAFNIHAREIGTAALMGAYRAKWPVPQWALIQRIGLVWPIRDGLSVDDILDSCHGFLVLRGDCFDLAHDLLVEQVRLDRKELLITECIPNKQSVAYGTDERDELKIAIDGATMLLNEVG